MLVVAAALVDADGRCLMQQRPRDKRHGGLWEFPGGKVEPGEHPAAALVRELDEELAIGVAVDALMPLGFATDMPVTMLLYHCVAWRGEPRALAAEALCWERPPVLARLPMPPVDVPLLAALARALADG
ncbi:(deoxy)nucleoside triphosphate pyrophosphohydrolase [Sphingomonas sp. NPDC079357]|jgi:8-oxo-dGTP diphosphatase|uniref:(deoxy)nucleoside triphosphate pyrophosphohydrolase n=1 Tax=Sphingomonas sp. NPDC079357 TaxID=3364518 RepID=UPI00384E278E